MDQKTKVVFLGWLNLSEKQRQDLLGAVRDFERQPSFKKESQLKEHRGAVKHYLGPVGSGCPCCGR
jgi:hypothetical protein